MRRNPFTTFLIVLFVLCIMGAIFAPWLVGLAIKFGALVPCGPATNPYDATYVPWFGECAVVYTGYHL